MRLVLGIGNPGSEYAGTRHNCGFAVLDRLVAHHGLAYERHKKWKAEVATWRLPAGWSAERCLLIRPKTYVNLSGHSAQAALAFHKLAPADLLVVVDDINLPLGTLRCRAQGSHGGHNGLRDIESRIGRGYPRLRLGIGSPLDDQVGHVLGRFAPEETPLAERLYQAGAETVETWLRAGIEAAQRHNGALAAELPPTMGEGDSPP